MAKSIGTLKIDLLAGTGQFKTAITGAQKHVENAVGKISSTVNGLAGVFGVGLGAGAFVGLIKSSINAADNLFDLAQKTGKTVEELAGLPYAADRSGTSMEAVAKAAQKLSTNMVDNKTLFAQFGITATTTTGALIQMADIFADMPDGVDKSALAVKLMGKSGAEMIPFLNQGSVALGELIAEGQRLNPVTAEMAAAADQFNDKMGELKMTAAGLGTSLANDMLPALNNIVSAMAAAAKEGGILNGIWVGLGGIGTAIFTDDMLSRSEVIKNRLDEISKMDASSWRVFDEEGIKNRRVEGYLLKDELTQLEKIAAIEKQRADFAVAHAKFIKSESGGAAGKKLLGALGGNDAAAKNAAKDEQSLADKRLEIIAKFYADDEEMAMKAAQARAQLATDDGEMRYRFYADDKAMADKAVAEEMERIRLLSGMEGAKEAMRDYAQSANDDFAQWGSFATSTMQTVEDAIVQMAMTGKVSSRDMARAIIADLVRIQAQKMIAGVVGNLSMASGSGGDVGAGLRDGTIGMPTGNANGGVYSGSPSLSAYSGSIVSKPTLFKFARGAGVMGEAGPEAILPLRRGADGKLGVAGGAGRSITINNVFTLNQPADRRTQGQVAAMAGASIQRAIARST